MSDRPRPRRRPRPRKSGLKWSRFCGQVFVAKRRIRLLPRSGYTKQPRALALGQVVSKSALEVAPDVRRAAGITREEPKDMPRPPLLRNMVEQPRVL